MGLSKGPAYTQVQAVYVDVSSSYVSGNHGYSHAVVPITPFALDVNTFDFNCVYFNKSSAYGIPSWTSWVINFPALPFTGISDGIQNNGTSSVYLITILREPNPSNPSTHRNAVMYRGQKSLTSAGVSLDTHVYLSDANYPTFDSGWSGLAYSIGDTSAYKTWKQTYDGLSLAYLWFEFQPLAGKTAQFKGAKVYSGNVLRADIIPVKFTDTNRYGLYDKVSGHWADHFEANNDAFITYFSGID